MTNITNLSKVAKVYHELGMHLIPLRPNGKAPLFTEWTTRAPHAPEELITWIGSGHNLGVRLNEHLLLIDVDVKHGQPGLVSLKRLEANFPDIASMKPVTLTPSGGMHYMLAILGADPLPLATHVEDYPGIEFLSKGRQALIGGCIIDKVAYQCDLDELVPLPEIPEGLYAILSRPRGSKTDSDNLSYGLLTDKTLKTYLAGLSSAHYRDYTEWLYLGMACHFLTAGEGREAWLEWSATDPQHGHSREENLIKWDSFDADRNIAITGRRLVRQLKKHDQGSLANDLEDLIDPDSAFEIEGSAIRDQKWIEVIELLNKTDDQNKLAAIYYAIAEGRFPADQEDVLTEKIRAKFKGVRIGSIRRRVNEAKNSVSYEIPEIDQESEDRQAVQRFIKDYGGDDAVVFSQNAYYMWEPERGYYVPYFDIEIGNKIDGWLNERSQPNSAKRLRDMKMLLQAARAIDKAQPYFWDVDELATGGMINTPSGELWIEKDGWELYEPNMENRQRTVIQAEYRADRPYPKVWHEYLDFALRGEHCDLMKRRLAIGIVYTAMSGYQWLKKAWVLHGPADTGKSKVLDVLEAIVGKQNCEASTFSDMQRNHGTQNLVGKMANIQAEIPKDVKVDASLFKAITGDSPININPKGGAPFKYRCECILWFAGNDLPEFARGSIGISDRITILEFANAKAKADLDEKLQSKLLKERDAIFTWAVDVYWNEVQNSRNVGACLEPTTEEELMLARRTTPGYEFIEEHINITEASDSFTTTDELYEHYCKTQGEFSMSKNSFGRRFANWIKQIHGLDTDRVYRGKATTAPQQAGWYGLELKAEQDEDDFL